MNHLYDELQDNAGKSRHHARVLMALTATLTHFNISEKERDTIAEALLRFRIVKDKNLQYDQQDQILAKFLQMDQYFGDLLRQTRKVPELPVGQRLTEQQLNEYPTWNLFHRLWTKAVGKDGYDKREWQEFEKRIQPLVT